MKAALGGAAGIALAGPARLLAAAGQAAPDAAVVRLSDDLFVVTVPGAANVVAHTAASGVVLVDGASAAASGALLKAVAALPGAGPVRTLFNTHWHPEQTGSNETLGKAGVTIIAHENTRLWLTTDVKWPWNGRRFTRLPQVAQPTKTFYTTRCARLRHPLWATSPTWPTPTATSTCTSRRRTCSSWATPCRAAAGRWWTG